MMPWRIAGWGRKIWPMFLPSCKPINLGIGFDLFKLPLNSGVSRTFRGMPCTLKVPLSESMWYTWGIFLVSLTGTPRVRGLFYSFFLVIPIHTRIYHRLDMGCSGGGECEVCCLGGLFHISNNPTCVHNTVTEPWHCLIYDWGYTTEVLGVKL